MPMKTPSVNRIDRGEAQGRDDGIANDLQRLEDLADSLRVVEQLRRAASKRIRQANRASGGNDGERAMRTDPTVGGLLEQ